MYGTSSSMSLAIYIYIIYITYILIIYIIYIVYTNNPHDMTHTPGVGWDKRDSPLCQKRPN